MSVERARTLRKNETDSERRVWGGLRLLRRHGFHFRRQAPIGKYYADFACHRAKIVVELDGLHHAPPEQRKHDAERTRFLESAGYRVVRFWNVEANPDSIAQQILELLGPPPPTPPGFAFGYAAASVPHGHAEADKRRRPLVGGGE